MRVVFLEDVPGVAQGGDVKEVKNGYARNYLIPSGLAAPALGGHLQRIEKIKQTAGQRRAKETQDMEQLAEIVGGTTVTIKARAGEGGRLYGSVTSRDIAQKVQETSGIEIDSRTVLLPEPIRELGSQTVVIKFTRNVSVSINVLVEPDEASKAIVEQLLVEQAEEDAAEAARAAANEAAANEAAAMAETNAVLVNDDTPEADTGDTPE